MKKIGICFLMLAMMLGLVPTVFADGTVTIKGGTLSITDKNFAFTDVTLTGRDQTVEYVTFETDWEAFDATGTGAGWHATIKVDSVNGQDAFQCVDSGDEGSEVTDELCYRHNIPLVTSVLTGGGDTEMSVLSFKVPEVTWVDGQKDASESGDKGLYPTVPEGFRLSYKALTATAQTFLSAAEKEGMGTYDFDPDFQFFVPAETYAGRYATTITVAISTAPE